MRYVAIITLAALLIGRFLWAADDASAVKRSIWQGFERLDFVVDGRPCLLVVPKTAAQGRPWIWRTEFFGHEPQADLALLARGFHVADLLKESKRIVFLGDSITAAGVYVACFDAWLAAKKDGVPQHVIDAGLPSETVSGLSEEGHAGGQFPRPDLTERLERVLALTKPDLVIACYGINCAIYEPFDVARFEAYHRGIRRLKLAVEERGARLVVITPPFYDDQQAPKSFSYNGVLDRYSDWLIEQRKAGWHVVDLHGPMTQEVAKRRAADPKFTFQPDGVHPNEAGQWYVARRLIGWFGDEKSAAAETPADMLKSLGAPAELLPLVQQRVNILRDAYVGAAGHKRPGVAAGLPVAEAEQQAAELSARIQKLLAAADVWTDISTAQIGQLGKQPWPGGCAGTVVNRLNGDVMVNMVGNGLWKSADQGQTWTRLDGGVISGRGECGWSVQVDQNDPKRVAVFSLDGDAGYTIDGTHWKKFTSLGRNWDFGSVDWADPTAKVILAGKHESGGEVYQSADGGTTWTKLPIVMDPVKKMDECMIGVMNASTFIYSYGNGIHRSTDGGTTWNQVSELQPRSKIPAHFKKSHYLCTSKGLIASSDAGATWQIQGESVDLWQGPFFGADEKTMVAAGPQGIYKTTTAGKNWTKVSGLRPNVNQNFSFATKWFGSYSWDPVKDVIYATAMAHPAFKNQLVAP